MRKSIAAAVTLFWALTAGAVPQGTPPPGISVTGSPTTGNCTSFSGPNSIGDAGSPCGGGSVGGGVSTIDVSVGGTISLTPYLQSGTIIVTGVLVQPLTLTVPTSWTGRMIIDNSVSGGGIPSLTTAVNTSQTTIPISSAINMPTSGNYLLLVGNEYMTVTGGQGTTTLTVTRGSSPGSYASGALAFQTNTGYYPVYVKYVGQTAASIIAGQGASSTIIGNGTSITLQSTTAGNNRCGSCIAFVGDSRLARYFSGTTALLPITNAYSFVGQALALNGQAQSVVYNGATSGWRSDQYFADGGATAAPLPVGGPSPVGVYGLSGAIASNAKQVMFWSIVNDIVQFSTTGDTLASIWQRVFYAAETARAAGMDVIFVSETGATSAGFTTPATQNPMVYQYNEHVKEYVEQFGQIPATGQQGIARYFDISATVMDPTQAAGTIAYLPGYSADGIHLTELGSYYAGVAFKNYLAAAAIPTGASWIWDTNDNTTAGNVQMLANPFFITATGGTCTSPCTGTVAGSWTVNVGGGATAAASVIANPLGGTDNAQQVACTFAAAGDFCRVDQIITNSHFPAGQAFESDAVVIMPASNPSGICLQPTMLTSYTDGAGLHSPRALYFSASTVATQVGGTQVVYYLRLPKQVITGTSTAGVLPEILLYGAAAGTCTFDVARFGTTLRFN